MPVTLERSFPISRDEYKYKKKNVQKVGLCTVPLTCETDRPIQHPENPNWVDPHLNLSDVKPEETLPNAH